MEYGDYARGQLVLDVMGDGGGVVVGVGGRKEWHFREVGEMDTCKNLIGWYNTFLICISLFTWNI